MRNWVISGWCSNGLRPPVYMSDKVRWLRRTTVDFVLADRFLAVAIYTLKQYNNPEFKGAV